MNQPKQHMPRPAQAREGLRRTVFWFVAIVVFVGLAVLLFVSMPYGIQNDDETTCISYAHRIMLGEFPLVENWTPTQLQGFVEYLPFRVLYSLLGGTEGIVLAVRYLYAAIKMMFFAAICLIFRQYRYWAILAAFVFTTFHPIGFISLTYYNTSILCAFAMGLLLFIKKKRTVFDLLCAGVLLAFCVLSQPAVILLYVIFSLCALGCFFAKKKGRGAVVSNLPVCSDGRSWVLITAGAALIACVVFTALLLHTDIIKLFTNAPKVLRLLQLHPQTGQWQKYHSYIDKTGYAVNIVAGLLLAVIAVLAFAAKKQFWKLRLPLFAAACAVFIWFTLEMFLRNGFVLSAMYLTVFKPIPLCFLGIASYLLTREKDRRLFAFCLFGISFSVFMDLLSRISLGTGAVIAAPASIFMFRKAALECVAQVRKPEADDEFPEKKAGYLFRLARLVCIPMAAALLVLLASEAVYSVHPKVFPMPDGIIGEQLTAQIERGPLRGLRTIRVLKGYYEAAMNDMDHMKSYDPQSMLVMDLCPWCNLYLDLPYGAFSFCYFNTPELQDCLLFYWSLNPDTKPDCIYIPFFGCDTYDIDRDKAESELAFMQSICDCTVEEGEIGFLLQIDRWKDFSSPQ